MYRPGQDLYRLRVYGKAVVQVITTPTDDAVVALRLRIAQLGREVDRWSQRFTEIRRVRFIVMTESAALSLSSDWRPRVRVIRRGGAADVVIIAGLCLRLSVRVRSF